MPQLRKAINRYQIDKKHNMNAPRFNPIDPKTELQIDIRNLVHEQLKTSEIQAKTTQKHYNISIFFTLAAIIISLIPLISELLNVKPNYDKSLVQLTESQSKLTKEFSNLSNRLLDYQNQVKILEKENELLKIKNIP